MSVSQARISTKLGDSLGTPHAVDTFVPSVCTDNAGPSNVFLPVTYVTKYVSQIAYYESEFSTASVLFVLNEILSRCLEDIG